MDDANKFFCVGRVFIDATHGRMRVAAIDGGGHVILISHGAEYRELLSTLRLRLSAGAIVADEVSALRDKVPQELRFNENRCVVTIFEIADKWRVDAEQVRNIIRRDKLKVLNISAGKKDARVHNRVSVSDYYRETLARLDLIDEARRWVWFGNDHSAF